MPPLSVREGFTDIVLSSGFRTFVTRVALGSLLVLLLAWIVGMWIQSSSRIDETRYLYLGPEHLDPKGRQSCSTSPELHRAWNISRCSCTKDNLCLTFSEMGMFMERIINPKRLNFVCTTLLNLPVRVPCLCTIRLTNGTFLSFSSYSITGKSLPFYRVSYTLPFLFGTKETFSDVIPYGLDIEYAILLDSSRISAHLEKYDVNTFLRAVSYYQPMF